MDKVIKCYKLHFFIVKLVDSRVSGVDLFDKGSHFTDTKKFRKDNALFYLCKSYLFFFSFLM